MGKRLTHISSTLATVIVQKFLMVSYIFFRVVKNHSSNLKLLLHNCGVVIIIGLL